MQKIGGSSVKKNKIASIVATTITCFVLLSVALYSLPVKVIPIDMSFDAIKTDRGGNECGTVPITVQGQISEYLFRKSRLTLEISDIEDLYDISFMISQNFSSSPSHEQAISTWLSVTTP